MKKTRLISLLVTIVMFLSLVNCQNTPQSNIQELGSKKDFKVNTLYYDDAGDVTEPIEEACAEGYTGYKTMISDILIKKILRSQMV